MKYLNTVLFTLLFLLTGILFFLHFSSNRKDRTENEAPVASKEAVLYVNIDTLLSKLEMYKDFQQGLEKKQQDLESNFAARYKSFENNVNDVQKRFSDPTAIITPIQKDQINQQLSKQKMDLDNLHNNYVNQLQQEGLDANRKMIEYIVEYLKEYSAGKGIQYILSYGFGGNILYTDNKLDITQEVVFGLNERYLKEKSLKK